MTAEEIAEGVKADDFAEKMAKGKYARNCADCFALPACEYCFGMWYAAKSNGGVGCRLPFTREQAEAIISAIGSGVGGEGRDPAARVAEAQAIAARRARNAAWALKAANPRSVASAVATLATTPPAEPKAANPLLARAGAARARSCAFADRIARLKGRKETDK